MMQAARISNKQVAQNIYLQKEREKKRKIVRVNHVKRHSARPLFSGIYLVQEELEVNR